MTKLIENSTYFKRMLLKFWDMFEARGYRYEKNVKRVDDKHVLKAIKPDGEHMMLLFLPKIKFNVRTAEHCVHFLESKAIKHVIIVYNESITCFARKVLDTELTKLGIDTKKFYESLKTLKMEEKLEEKLKIK